MMCVILNHYLTPWLELYGSASTLTLNFCEKSAKIHQNDPFLPKMTKFFPQKIFLSIPDYRPGRLCHSEPFFDLLAGTIW